MKHSIYKSFDFFINSYGVNTFQRAPNSELLWSMELGQTKARHGKCKHILIHFKPVNSPWLKYDHGLCTACSKMVIFLENNILVRILVC